MNFVVYDNLNIILMKGSGYLLIDACELDMVEGGNLKKNWKTWRTIVFKKLDENKCPLYLYKLTFLNFSWCVVMSH